MKRFYCTVCKRIKRVRSYPQNIQSMDATQPQDRIGSCDRHSTSNQSIQSIMRTRVWNEMSQGKTNQMKRGA